MKKYIISNILFTTSFLLVMIPAFYLLINHVLEYTEPSPMATDVFDYGSHTHDFHQINKDDKPF